MKALPADNAVCRLCPARGSLCGACPVAAVGRARWLHWAPPAVMVAALVVLALALLRG